MEELALYFEPLDAGLFRTGPEGKTLGDTTVFHTSGNFPEKEDGDIAIIGVCENRGGASPSRADQAPDAVREYFYRLYAAGRNFRLMDLGNIHPGETIEDTYFALQKTIEVLVKKNVIPVIIGGTQDLTYANYKGYESLEQTVNVLSVDTHFDMGDVEGPLHSQAYLGKIVLHRPNYLFNFSNIGYQSYFVDGGHLDLMEGLYFDVHRLGEIRADMTSAEPIVRNADMVTFDMSAIRLSDAPGTMNGGPHGFYGEEACQICRYAGMSDKLTSIGFYELDPEKDRGGQTVHLLAQMIWYFADGYYGRKTDFPMGHKEDYTRYLVQVNGHDDDIVFLKSPRSDRWWMEVPYPPDKRLRFERHCLVPCSYADYEQAMKHELPDLWLRTYKKLS